jgi:hypothetical protein
MNYYLIPQAPPVAAAAAAAVPEVLETPAVATVIDAAPEVSETPVVAVVAPTVQKKSVGLNKFQKEIKELESKLVAVNETLVATQADLRLAKESDSDKHVKNSLLKQRIARLETELEQARAGTAENKIPTVQTEPVREIVHVIVKDNDRIIQLETEVGVLNATVCKLTRELEARPVTVTESEDTPVTTRQVPLVQTLAPTVPKKYNIGKKRVGA